MTTTRAMIAAVVVAVASAVGAAENAATLPVGHPELPVGHPAIGAATTRPAMMGTLEVRVEQGTKGGAAVAGDVVTVDFYRGENVIKEAEGKVDAAGRLSVTGVPVATGAVQALVRVSHGGVVFEGVSAEMTATRPAGEVKVAVYEGSEAAPAWEVGMRHVMLTPGGDVMHVMEMVSVSVPGDRAWVGKSENGKRTTFELTLPAGAKDVHFGGGFEEHGAEFVGGKVINHAAVVPGATRYQLGYEVPVAGGKVEISAVAPAPVKHMMVFMPEDGSVATAEGLSGGVADMGGGKTRYFKGEDLAAGSRVVVALSGISGAATAASTSSAGAADAAGDIAKVVAGVGGLLIVLFGGAVMFAKGAKGAKGKRQ